MIGLIHILSGKCALREMTFEYLMEVKDSSIIVTFGSPKCPRIAALLELPVGVSSAVDMNSNHYARHHRLTSNNHPTNN
jgi:hypothetical protein